MRIVLLGPPGAGKGTVAKLLKKTLDLSHISTGDIFREQMGNNTELGKKIKSFVESGALVPDEVVTEIVKNKLTSDPELEKGYLLDGFPRTKQQAEDLDKILHESGNPIDYVIYMESTLPVIVRRITGRRVCKSCGAIYHVTNRPPKKENVCDNCGSEIYQRPDDTEETITKRMDVYIKSTEPIIKYYQNQGRLKKVDADQEAEDVETLLMKVFNEDGKFDSNKVAEGN